jgi:hypothetical protein
VETFQKNGQFAIADTQKTAYNEVHLYRSFFTFLPLQVAWTGISALVSMISLGWGIAAYISALRITRDDRNKLSWTGIILQIFWRVGMLSARLMALTVLALALHQWTFIVMCNNFDLLLWL